MFTPDELDRLGWICDNPKFPQAAADLINRWRGGSPNPFDTRWANPELKKIHKALLKLTPQAVEVLNNRLFFTGASVNDLLEATRQHDAGGRRRDLRRDGLASDAAVLLQRFEVDEGVSPTHSKSPLVRFLKVLKEHIEPSWDAREIAREYVKFNHSG